MSVRIWKSLGIAPTRDKKAINRAFQLRKAQADKNLREIWLLEEDYRQALRMAEDSGYLIQSSTAAYDAEPKTRPHQPDPSPQVFQEEEQKAKGSGCSSVLGILFFLIIIGFKTGFLTDMLSSFTQKEDPPTEELLQMNHFANAILYCDTVATSQALAAGENPNQLVDEIPAFCLTISFCPQELSILLLSAGADPNITDKNGANSLHYAVTAGSKEMVEILLGLHANVKQRDNNGLTPRDLAIAKGQTEIADLLSQYMEPPAQPEQEE